MSRSRRPVLRWSLTIVWISMCGLLAGAKCPAPNNGSLPGVHGDAGRSLQALDVVKNAGFKWFRVQALWRGLEIADGVYDPVALAELDQKIINVAERGFSVLLYFHNVPSWANGGSGPKAPPTAANADKYGEFLTDIVNHRLPGTAFTDPWPRGFLIGEVVAAYEVWNEPNLSDFWTGTQAQWKDRILRPAINALKALRVDPPGFYPVEIYAPSVYINYNKSQNPNLSNWVSGYGPDIDYVSVHTYGNEATQVQEMGDVDSWCNSHLDTHCFGGAFVVTEAGFCTSGCSQSNTSANVGAALLHTQNKCVNSNWCFGNFIFNLFDVEGDSGLVNDLIEVRPRLCHLEQNYGAPLVVAAPCPCPAPGCSNF